MANLPYVYAVGTLTKMLEKIRSAAVPSTFSQDFVTKTMLMKGGTARATIPFIKKMGLVADDGTPTELYKQFRNEKKSKGAIAAAMRTLYAPLFAMNEKVYELPESEVRGLIVEATGGEKDSQVTKLTVATFAALKGLADFSDATAPQDRSSKQPKPESLAIPSVIGNGNQQPSADGEVGINLSYTINLNLPATSDIAVFNAIFKSLKEHLLQK